MSFYPNIPGCISYLSGAGVKQHDRDNSRNKELILAYGSRWLRVHGGGETLAASARHDGQSSKLRTHVLNHKHRLCSELASGDLLPGARLRLLNLPDSTTVSLGGLWKPALCLPLGCGSESCGPGCCLWGPPLVLSHYGKECCSGPLP